MRKSRLAFLVVTCTVPGLAYDAFLQARHLNIARHVYQIRFTTLLYGLLGCLILMALEWLRQRTHPPLAETEKAGPQAANLAWWLTSVPVLTTPWFWTVADIQKRYHWAFALSALTYFLWGWQPHVRACLGFVAQRMGSLLRWAVIGALIGLFGVVSGALQRPFAGDEIHILMVTRSIAEEGDLQVADDYTTASYGLITETRVAYPGPRGPWTRVGLSPVAPGLPLLLVPAYRMALWYPPWFVAIIRCFMVLLALWSVHGLYQLTRRLIPGLANGNLTTLLFALSLPALAHAWQVTPAFLVLGLMTRAFLSWHGAAADNSRWRGALLVALMPMFDSYMWGPVLLWGVLSLYRGRKCPDRLSSMSRFAAGAAAGLFLLAVYQGLRLNLGALLAPRVWWPWLTGSAIWNARISSWLSYFLDQRMGLLFYAPVYFFGLLGWVHWYRHDRRNAAYVLFLFLAFGLTLGLAGFRPQAAPPAGALLPVLWCVAVCWPHWWHAHHRPWVRASASICILFSLLIPWFMAAHPEYLYDATALPGPRASPAFAQLSNLAVFVPDLLPSYPPGVNGPWWPNYAWSALFLFTVLLYVGRLMRFRIEAVILPQISRALSAGVLVALVSTTLVWLTSGYPRVVPTAQAHVRHPGDRVDWWYPPERCRLLSDRPAPAWACSTEKRFGLVVRHSMARAGFQMELECRDRAPRLGYHLRWFDLRPEPVLAEARRQVYYKHAWPYWAPLLGARWGALEIVPEPGNRKCHWVRISARILGGS